MCLKKVQLKFVWSCNLSKGFAERFVQFFVTFNRQLFRAFLELLLKVRLTLIEAWKSPFFRQKRPLNVTFLESHRIDQTSSSSIQDVHIRNSTYKCLRLLVYFHLPLNTHVIFLKSSRPFTSIDLSDILNCFEITGHAAFKYQEATMQVPVGEFSLLLALFTSVYVYM